jgi:hypothetical protein
LIGLGINVSRPIAETLIIVVGVLLALGVDSWNDNRIDRILEVQYLERLTEDIQYNAGLFGGAPEEAFNEKLEYLAEVAEIASQPQEYQPDPDSVISALYWSAGLGWAIPEFRTGTFEELKSTGNLGIIGDLDLRTALNEYDLSQRNRRGRIYARMTEYPDYIYTLHPGLMADSSADLQPESWKIDSDSVEEVLDTMRTSEFRRLLNAERNYAVFGKA